MYDLDFSARCAGRRGGANASVMGRMESFPTFPLHPNGFAAVNTLAFWDGILYAWEHECACVDQTRGIE